MAGRRLAEAALTAVGGAALGAAAALPLGLSLPAAAVGGLNGALSGWRQTYDFGDGRGVVAFVLDSTWGLVTTGASLAVHALGVVRGRPGYVESLSRRQNRHVYARGFQLRPGFLTTFGNVICGAGDTSNERRARLITDHEDVHVWQIRWFGPLFPLLYGGWMLAGGTVGAVLWLVRGRRGSLGRMVESCAYYLNPFEWWAYSRDDNWPPPGLVSSLGPRRPMIRPFRHPAGG